jgi:hypothetical protein
MVVATLPQVVTNHASEGSQNADKLSDSNPNTPELGAIGRLNSYSVSFSL